MKNCLAILLVLFTSAAFCQSLIGEQFGVAEEVKQVVLNHQSHNAKRLRIEFENSKGKIFNMRFKFLSDSTFGYKLKKTKSEHVIRGKQIFNIGASEIKKEEGKIFKNQALETTVINGVVSKNLYYVSGNDSILFSTHSTKIDSIENSTTLISKHRSGGKNWKGSKQIVTHFSKDLIRTQTFQLVNNVNWVLKLDKVDILLKSRTEFSRTQLKLSKGKSAYEDEDKSEEFFNINNERKSIVHHDPLGLIDAVVIVHKNTIDDFTEKIIEHLILYPHF